MSIAAAANRNGSRALTVASTPITAIDTGGKRIHGMLIREVPDEIIAAIASHASRLGLSRSEHVRRRLARDAAIAESHVTVADLTGFAAHRTQWGIEPDPTSVALTRLTAAEQSLYQSLLNGAFGERLGLEQEFISFASVVAAAGVVINDDFRADPGPG
jgi:hypothetical protein